MNSFDILYQSMLDNSDDAICHFEVLDSHILIANYNLSFLETGIINMPNPKGKSIEEIFDKEIQLELVSKINKCLDLKKSLKYLLNYNLKGTELYWNVSLNPLFIEGKTFVFVFYKDVTETILEQRKKETLLSEYNCLFEASVNPTCLIVFDENNVMKIERQNKPMENLKAMYMQNRITFNCEEVFSNLIREKKQINGDFCIDMQDNHFLYYSFTILPIIKDTRVVKAFLICINITKKSKLSKKLNTTNITNREQQVLDLVIEGNTNKYIAFKLHITEGTVKKILSNTYKKLQITSRSELLKLYLCDKYTYTDN